MTRENLAYAAGIVDGEGCIGIFRRVNRQAFRTHITVAMCELAVPEFLFQIFGGSLSKHERLFRPNAREQYVWLVAAQKAAECARAILPYLRIKQAQAENLIELQEINQKIRAATTTQRAERGGGLRLKGNSKSLPII